MPATPPSALEYERLSFHAAVHFARDAAVLAADRRYAGVIISCQHAWERMGKSALAFEAHYSFPPTRSGGPLWMRDHRVLANVDQVCMKFRVPVRGRLRRALQNLELWLPPGPNLSNPPLNSEYIFDGGAVWRIPANYFRRNHSRSSLWAVEECLKSAKISYAQQLHHISMRL